MGVASIFQGELGYVTVGTANAATTQLNAANNRFAFSFIAPPTSLTLTEVACYTSALTGTVAASEYKAELQSDTAAGIPDNTPLETVNCNQTPSAGAINTWTFTTTLTPGARYWIVFKNTNATPASNFVTNQFAGTNSTNQVYTQDATNDWCRRVSTDAGTTWTTGSVTGGIGMRLGYSDGTYDGFPFYSQANSVVGQGIYSARELGNMFTSPTNAITVVTGIRFNLTTKTGTPTGNLRFRLYSGTTLLDTTVNLPTVSPITAMYRCMFATPVILPPNTVCRATISETTQSDASGNRFNARVFEIFPDATSRAMMPFAGTMQLTYYDGGSWSQSQNQFIPMLLLASTIPSGGLFIPVE